MSVMKNSLPMSINIVGTAVGSLFTLPKNPSASMLKNLATEKQTRRKTSSTWGKIRRQPMLSSLVFKQKLAFYPHIFTIQEPGTNLLPTSKSAKLAKQISEALANFSLCAICPIPGSLFHLRTIPKTPGIILSD